MRGNEGVFGGITWGKFRIVLFSIKGETGENKGEIGEWWEGIKVEMEREWWEIGGKKRINSLPPSPKFLLFLPHFTPISPQFYLHNTPIWLPFPSSSPFPSSPADPPTPP